MAYEIDININGDLDALPAAAGDTAADAKNKGDKDSDASKGAKALANYIKGQAINPIINAVKTQISQNVGLITGSQELQERVNFGMQLVETGQSLWTNAQGGMVLANTLGLSSGVGAAIGVAFGVMNLGMQIAFRQEQLNLREGLEEIQIVNTKSRMGTNVNKSRTRGRE